MNSPMHVGHGYDLGYVTLFPMWTEEPAINGLDWTGKTITVVELPGGNLDFVFAVNDSRKDVAMLEGDILVGGIQDRMVAESLTIHPGTAEIVKVVGIERDRLGGGDGFELIGYRGTPSVRFGLAKAREKLVTQAWQHDHEMIPYEPRPENAPQFQVWEYIRRYVSTLGVLPTSSMAEYLKHEPGLNPPRLAGQRGVIVGIGGTVAWGEIFGNTAGLARRWPGIVRSALLDASLLKVAHYTPGMLTPTPASAARKFARAWASLAAEHDGETDLLVPMVSDKEPPLMKATEELTLTGLRHNQRTIHATLFNNAHPLMELR